MASDTQSVYVSHDYVMNPEFDDLVLGSDLRDGMVVLIEDPGLRAWMSDKGGSARASDKRRAMECNRWCTVSGLRVISSGDAGALVKFVGLYADGTKFPRTYAAAYYWVVKKDSVGQ